MADLTHARSCHRFACAHGWRELDDETRDMLSWPVRDRASACVFHCTARPNKLCRGVVSALGLTEADLREAGWTECSACGATVAPDGWCPVCEPTPDLPDPTIFLANPC